MRTRTTVSAVLVAVAFGLTLIGAGAAGAQDSEGHGAVSSAVSATDRQTGAQASAGVLVPDATAIEYGL
ncbi:hypothetical protein [Streptomyces sp. NPDC003077]|uniref:hypothetical protein n=1 Tax=Streptomyces sp. NPDC003077 TaxID=3154443 RepID=UPI0033A548EA